MSMAYQVGLCLLVIFTCQVIGCVNAQVQHDDALASQITAVLLASDELNLSRIEVNVEKGRVYLSGMADDHASKTHAESEARKVSGVTTVVNKIEVDF